MTQRDREKAAGLHGVGEEPHLREPRLGARGAARSDSSEDRAAKILADEARHRRPTDELAHSVWDEPAIAVHQAVPAVPAGAEYAAWLAERRMRTGTLQSWLVALGTALASGPLAVLGVLLGTSGSSAFQLLSVVLIGPVAEEVMKNALALYLVEKRPYLFRNRLQLALSAVTSGLAFAAIENVLYLHLGPSAAPALLVEWRWTVCVALHVGCALVYALGLMRIWADAWFRRARPRLELGVPHAVAAMAIHGSYNAIVTLLELGGLSF